MTQPQPPCPKITIAEMGPQDMALVLDWAAAEGWNPGLADAPAFLAADPQGFFLAQAQLPDGPRPVAAISVVNHDPAQAFLGLYICHPDWRGRGIGWTLWRAALAHAGTRSIGLDGVAAQQDNYARSGFVRQGATRRFLGRMEAREDPAIRPVQAAQIDALLALDLAACGVARPNFLRAWLYPEDTRRSLVLERAGQPAGFVTIRRCRSGAKIGPVIAPDAPAALALIRAALAQLPCEDVAIDLPEANHALALALQSAGFVVSFETARMYRGPAPCPLQPDWQQAIATMELG